MKASQLLGTIESLNEFQLKSLAECVNILSEKQLVELWNKFVLESGWYGIDSIIYDISDKDDVQFLLDHFSEEDLEIANELIKNEHPRFIQWFDADCSIRGVKDIVSIIINYWSEISTRIMSFPSLYDREETEIVMEKVFYPLIREFCGIEYKENNF